MKKTKGNIGPLVKGQDNKADKDDITPQPAVDEDIEAQSIDKIRDILFGSQARQYKQKFTRLEALLQKETADLRNEIKKSFDSLENYAKKELESLADQLQTEKDDRTSSVKELFGMLKDTNKNLEKKVTELKGRNVKSQKELQKQILQQSKDLTEEILSKHEEISASLEQSVKELGKNKTDRLTLANLLMDMSLHLKEEFNIPEVD